jgi:branched-chain amino acid transport system permease protein
VLGSILVFSVVWGALYALTSLGFSLLFGAAGIVNLAHGAFFMVASYAAFAFSSQLLHLPLWLAAVCAIALTVAIGVGVYGVTFRPVQADEPRLLMVGIGVALLLQQAVRLIYGPAPKYVPSLHGGFFVLGARVTTQQVVVVAGSCALIGAISYFLRVARLGKILRAVAQDGTMAELLGVDTRRVYIGVMALSAALAGAAGVLAAPFLDVSPDMGWPLMLVAFVAVAVGGVQSIAGMGAAALVLSTAQTLSNFLISPALGNIVIFVILIALLTVRPQGLFGEAQT